MSVFDKMRKKEAEEAAQSGRVIWIEPNKIDEVSDTGTFNYEDYSICVDLEVRIPRRGSCGDEKETIRFHTTHETEKDRISFFTGTDGFLTTTFTNITANDPTSNKETLGVSSIDITYNSYFYPQVTIKFVDVRGSSLMYPQEDSLRNRTQGSFFKSLFCFPYPQFILKIKGFYGKQIQYELAVEDFRSAFNSETGNFECTVKFIGYMYGVYADLPMSYLIVAPYAKISGLGQHITGGDYWNQKVSDNVFVYDNQKPIHKFFHLSSLITTAENNIKNALVNNPLVVEKNKLIDENNDLNSIDIAYTLLVKSIGTNGVNYKKGKNQLVFYSENEFKENISDETLSKWGTLNGMIGSYNLDSKQDLNYLSGIKSKYTNEIRESLGNIKEITNSLDFFNNIKDSDLKTDIFKEELLKMNNFHGLIIDCFNFYTYISERKEYINKRIDELSKSIELETQSIFAETLGFVPTLDNIFRIIFAHMDTFVQTYYAVLDNIKNNKNRRTPISFELTANNSDITGIEDFIPPYPLVTTEKGVAMWPGNYDPAVRNDMVELKYVDGLFNGINNIEAQIKADESRVTYSTTSLNIRSAQTNNYVSDTTSSINIIPNSLSDLYFFKNPYDYFIENENIKKDAIFSILGIRLLDDPYRDAETKGYIEACNFYKIVQKLNKLNSNQLEFANLLGGNADPKEFLTYIRNSGDDNLYHGSEKIFNETKYPLNFSNPQKILYDKKSKTKYYPENNIVLTNIDINGIPFFFDVYHRVVANGNITDDKKLGKYKTFWDKTIQVPNNKKLSSYASNEVNKFKRDIINSIVIGDFNGYFWEENVKNLFYQTYYHGDKKFFNGMYIHDDEIKKYQHSLKCKSNRNKEKILLDTKQTSYDAAINALDYDNHVVDPSFFKGASLFGSKAYYAQNDVYAKAYLFLEACAPLAQADINFNKVTIMTNWTSLLLGARLWRMTPECTLVAPNGYKLPKENNIPLQTYVETSTVSRNLGETNSEIVKVTISGFAKNIDEYQMQPMNTKSLSDKDKEMLINNFKNWVSGNFNGLSFKTIMENLELRSVNKNVLSETDIDYLKKICKYYNDKGKDSINIKEFIEKKGNKNNNCTLYKLIKDIDGEIKLNDLFNKILSSDTCNRYCLIAEGEDGVYLTIKPDENGFSKELFKSKIKNSIQILSPIRTPYYVKNEVYFKDAYISFVKHLNNLYKNNNGFIDLNTTEEETIVSSITNNDDLKLSLYLTLKNLYDRWFCGLDRKRWSFDLYRGGDDIREFEDLTEDEQKCEFNKFYFIDSFYENIGSQVVLDLNTLKELLDSVITNRIGDSEVAPNGMKFQGMAVYQFMSSILQKNSMLFMAVPCFNTYKNIEDIKELFTPYSWFDRGEPKGTSYVGIYPHNPSKNLNIEDDSGEYNYHDDTFNFTDENGDFKDIELVNLLEATKGYTMPSFGVTFGKQDQSYFKKITVNMDNPQVTEYSIAATLDIAKRGEQKSNTFVGQDLYKVYSNHSYTCTVEMMGNAMITPLMYFQLNNIPLFRGAYMIVKVEHNISQGDMTTVFTGVRMSRFKTPFVSPIIETKEVIDNISNINSDNAVNKTNVVINDIDNPITLTSENKKKNDVNSFLEAARYALNQSIKEEPNGSNKVPEIPELPVQGLKDGYAWCAIFVGWCSEMAGLNPDIINGSGWYRGKNWKYGYNAQCNAIYSYYTKLNRVILMTDENKVNNPPQPGDLILFRKTSEYESNNDFGHIGIIESYNPDTDTITYIHGNYSNQVKRTKKSYNEKTIGCYVRPPFENSSIIINDKITVSTSENKTNTPIEIDDEDIIISTPSEKIAFINATIWQESSNKHNEVGDEKKTNPAYGILQIRKPMFNEVNRLRKSAKNKSLGEIIEGDGDKECMINLDRDTQVQMFISVLEYINSDRKSYVKTGNIDERNGSSIKWSMKDSVAKWNGGSVKKKKETENYFKQVKKKYLDLSEDSKSMPDPIDNPGWESYNAFEAFFA